MIRSLVADALSVRGVPVVEILSESNLSLLIGSQDFQPRGPMFPQYWTNKYNRRNDHASKVNSEFVRNLGIKDRRKAPMHSWRYFAKTYFKNDPRVKEEIHDAITGHGSDSEGRRYGVYELRAMAKAIALLPNPLRQSGPPAIG